MVIGKGILGVTVQIFGTWRNLYTCVGMSLSNDVLFLTLLLYVSQAFATDLIICTEKQF